MKSTQTISYNSIGNRFKATSSTHFANKAQSSKSSSVTTYERANAI